MNKVKIEIDDCIDCDGYKCGHAYCNELKKELFYDDKLDKFPIPNDCPELIKQKEKETKQLDEYKEAVEFMAKTKSKLIFNA